MTETIIKIFYIFVLICLMSPFISFLWFLIRGRKWISIWQSCWWLHHLLLGGCRSRFTVLPNCIYIHAVTKSVPRGGNLLINLGRYKMIMQRWCEIEEKVTWQVKNHFLNRYYCLGCEDREEKGIRKTSSGRIVPSSTPLHPIPWGARPCGVMTRGGGIIWKKIII